MDVGIITWNTWEGIYRLLIVIWLVVPLAIIFGGSLLLSMALIPSLISTGELPPNTGRLRRPLYAVALVSGAALVAVLIAMFRAAGVIAEFWPRWSI